MQPYRPQPWEAVRLAAGLADQKEDHYRLLLAFDALLELLTDRGLITREELARKAAAMDAAAEPGHVRLHAAAVRAAAQSGQAFFAPRDTADVPPPIAD